MTAPTNADALEAIECAAICLENWGGIHEARDLRAAVAAIIEERDALAAENKALNELVAEGRRAIGEHFAPNDCYATGPVTGDMYRDLVECPACSFIAMHDAHAARCKGGA